ncbi:unnamed protein product [Lymnaea stagnalis]|uniref:Peptidase S1 domain-containing protein n=1 Tax=Lymnaea stagnalis TaxID=6523 RepID=A0AAV2HTI9_LYMST
MERTIWLTSTIFPHLFLTVLSSITSTGNPCEIFAIEEQGIEIYQEMYNKFTGRSQLNSSEPESPENTTLQDLLDQLPCGLSAMHPYEAIVGGGPAPETVFPWQVAFSRDGKFCGGVLISKSWALTAAHCFKTNKSVTVLGSLNLYGDKDNPSAQERTPKVVVVHEDYNSTALTDDVALVKFDSPVVFNDHVKPICLPRKEDDFEGVESCFVSGWGKVSPNGSQPVPPLQFGGNRLMPQSICVYTWRLFSQIVDRRQVCTDLVGPSVCYGDSGGPISCKVGGRYYVVGLTSFVGIRDNCMGKLFPNVFVRVSEYTNWMLKVIQEHGF